MIQSLQINHFRNHVGTRFEFGRFTLLAGPNGVGKSNVLKCLDSFGDIGDHVVFSHEFELDPAKEDFVISFDRGSEQWIAASEDSYLHGFHEKFVNYRLIDQSAYSEEVTGIVGVRFPSGTVEEVSSNEFSGFFYLKPELPNLSSPHYSESAHPTLHSSGLGLASVLAYLMTSAPERFARIQEALREIVPQVVRIRAVREMVEIPELQTVTVKSREIAYTEKRQVPGDALVFDMKNAEGLWARDVSDGTLIVLALLTAIHQEPQPRVLLLDDIETGLHPAAQANPHRPRAYGGKGAEGMKKEIPSS